MLTAAGAVVVAACLMPGAHAAARPSLPRIGAFVPAHPEALLPTSAGTVDSLNWAGYAVTAPAGQTVTAVDSTFTVPTIDSATPGFAAIWDGIGGYQASSADLIQAGVGEEFVPGLGSQYYAWYELLPATETSLTGCTGDPACTVSPGDTVSVAIAEVSPGRWSVTMKDIARWEYHAVLAYASSGSSAEWIEEAPNVVVQSILPDMTDTHFSGDTYTLAGGSPVPVASGNPVTIDLSLVGIPEALPSALDGTGKRFRVCVYQPGC